jgi:hypothetical protein
VLPLPGGAVDGAFNGVVDGVVDGVERVPHLIAPAGWGAEDASVVRLGCELGPVMGRVWRSSMASVVSSCWGVFGELKLQMIQQRLSFGAPALLSRVIFHPLSTGRRVSGLRVILPVRQTVPPAVSQLTHWTAVGRA